MKASFTVLPEQPKLGDDVAFTATSTGGTVHDWDLDGDGDFDDANRAKARTQFTTPGPHTVRLRTTNPLYGNSDVATREFSFEGEPTPRTPTPSPPRRHPVSTASPAPTASPEPPPAANAAPVPAWTASARRSAR